MVLYALLNKKIKSAVTGIDSCQVVGTNLIFNFTDGTSQTMTFPSPKDGISITDVSINKTNHLIITLSDNKNIDAGLIPTAKGDNGFTPTIAENPDNTNEIYKLDITNENGMFTTPNLKGAGGGLDPDKYYDKTQIDAFIEPLDKAKHTHDNKETVLDKLTTDDTGDTLLFNGNAIKGSVEIDDTTITATDKTWSAKKINESAGVGKAGTGENAEIFNNYKDNDASGIYSHAEGHTTTASGHSSHAEGTTTTASGLNAHAGGHIAVAGKICTFAHGEIVEAISNDYEVAFGAFNKSNTDTLFSIGNGTDENKRSNAFEITKTTGKLFDKELATKEDIPTTLPANGGNADTLGNRPPEDFANTCNASLDQYLSGKSGDIRALAHLLPPGGFSADTSWFTDVAFPMTGTILLTWTRSSYKVDSNTYLYGVLTVRPLASTGDTYICSVYNTKLYTDWQKLNDGGNADTANTSNSLQYNGAIGTSEDLMYHSILDWAVAHLGREAYAYVIDGYGYPTDVPAKAEGCVTVKSDDYGRQVVIYIQYTGSKVWKRDIFKGSWKTSWTIIADGGNADTLGGKSASEFLQDIGGLTSGSLLEYALTLSASGWLVAGPNVTDTPNPGKTFFVEVRNYNGYLELVACQTGANTVSVNNYNRESWFGWHNVSDNGNAASVGVYTAEKLAALEARIAALEGK